MKTETQSATLRTAERPTSTSFSERIVLARLAGVQSGSLTILANGRRHVFGREDAALPPAIVRVHDARFWSAVVQRGSVGAGEAYAKGWWSSDDPTAVVRLFVRNGEVLAGVESGIARISRAAMWLYHALRSNTEQGSRANIAAHYDLSNDFFRLFLDETMTYSCGIFESPQSTMREASLAKIERICRKLDLRPGDHLLEIGTGWGALAIHAARDFGCRVTTTTISREQFELATARVRSSGLEGRITILLEDYRRLQGSFDKLVSVEMIEAVGHRYYGQFFQRCATLLRPEGRMCLQAITIADQQYETARRSVDFIQRHIFPGSCIPSVSALCASMTRASDLRLVQLEDIGPHYVRTLAEWRRRLLEHANEAQELGFTREFLRLWEFYFCYCEGGFAERQLSDVQMLLERPLARPAALAIGS